MNFTRVSFVQFGLPGVLAPIGVVVLVWFLLIEFISGDWMIDPQYGYGFLVPFITLGLLWRRLSDFPSATNPGSLTLLMADLSALFAVLLFAFIIPMWESNPDWRLLGVAASCAAFVILTAVILHLGGWPWVKHLAFPFCFFLIAVPWPRNFEQGVMTKLVSWNVDVAIEILHWLGYEALKQGNLICLQVGTLGMEDACSGIRSLQAGMMVALFFGEYFRLSRSRRILLIIVGFIGALIGNIGRSSVLAVVASLHGMSAVTSWHDFAGWFVLLITVSSVICLALFFRSKTTISNWSDYSAERIFSFPRPLYLSRLAVAFFCSLLAILLLSIVGTRYWFAIHEQEIPLAAEWDIHPLSRPGVIPITVPEATRKLLFNPTGFSEKWFGKDGEQGQVFYFRWPPGRIAVQSILAMHSPVVCLSSIGMRLKYQLPSVVIQRDGITLQFQCRVFEQNGRFIYVYNAMPLSYQLPSGEIEALDDSPKGRLRSLFKGLRNRGQRMVEIAFWNLPDEEVAKKALFRYLDDALFKTYGIPPTGNSNALMRSGFSQIINDR